MKPPIIVSEHGDISFYRNAAEAELALEAIDVRNGEYIAFDGLGRPLVLSIVCKKRDGAFGFFSKYIEIVRLDLDHDAVVDEIKVRGLLTEFLKRANICMPENEDKDFVSFIKSLVTVCGYSN
jgi:hypothetical protein